MEKNQPPPLEYMKNILYTQIQLFFMSLFITFIKNVSQWCMKQNVTLPPSVSEKKFLKTPTSPPPQNVPANWDPSHLAPFQLR